MSRINYIDDDFNYVIRAEGEKTVVLPANSKNKAIAHALAKSYGLTEMPTPERRAEVKLIKVGPQIKTNGEKGTLMRRVTILDEDNRKIQVNMWENNFTHEEAPWVGSTDDAEMFADWVEENGIPEMSASLQPSMVNGKKVAALWVSHLTPGNGFAKDISDDIFDLVGDDTPVKKMSARELALALDEGI
jgi:hypothetical protein